MRFWAPDLTGLSAGSVSRSAFGEPRPATGARSFASADGAPYVWHPGWRASARGRGPSGLPKAPVRRSPYMDEMLARCPFKSENRANKALGRVRAVRLNNSTLPEPDRARIEL
jgi:hypothetical protein